MQIRALYIRVLPRFTFDQSSKKVGSFRVIFMVFRRKGMHIFSSSGSVTEEKLKKKKLNNKIVGNEKKNSIEKC